MVQTWKMRHLGRGTLGRKFRKQLWKATLHHIFTQGPLTVGLPDVAAKGHCHHSPTNWRRKQKCPFPPALLGCGLPRHSLLLFPSMAHTEERAQCHFLVTPLHLPTCPTAPPQSPVFLSLPSWFLSPSHATKRKIHSRTHLLHVPQPTTGNL